MSGTDNITDTNTEPTIELETETMVIELSCVNEAGIAGSDIPPVDSSESLSEIANIDIKRVRKRALSGQQVQADSLTKNTKTKLTPLDWPLLWQFLWIGHSCGSFSRLTILVAVSLD